MHIHSNEKKIIYKLNVDEVNDVFPETELQCLSNEMTI